MTIARWRPSRAGILNVYQYEDETLHFAGGRLLLRGVNGSGKSTAMNMLLPFLLEADTRKIDAAGEQTGVLRSWMLADTDETQRTGYLWIEFARADPDAPGGLRHHTVGCGIRANRSTDRVTPVVVLDTARLAEARRPTAVLCTSVDENPHVDIDGPQTSRRDEAARRSPDFLRLSSHTSLGSSVSRPASAVTRLSDVDHARRRCPLLVGWARMPPWRC